MKEETYHFTTNDNSKLFVYKWLPNSEIKCVLFLVHGSVEHAYRYRRFAEFLTQNNIAVIAPDLRGHGQTVKINGQYSYFTDNDGWNTVVSDLSLLKQEIIEEYSNKPVFVLGHSMGSIFVRTLISRDAKNINGAIVMGSTYGKFTLVRISLIILRFFLLFRKSNSTSPFFHSMVFGRFARSIKNPKTNVDFISRDEEEVQKYIDDSLCGITLTLNYAQQMAKGSLIAASSKALKSTPANLPILLISGMADPVGGENAIEVKNLYEAYRKNGKTKVDLKLYENARHELLNDINRDEVMTDILNWINAKLDS